MNDNILYWKQNYVLNVWHTILAGFSSLMQCTRIFIIHLILQIFYFGPMRLVVCRHIALLAFVILYLRVNGDVGPARSACRVKETEPESDFDKTWTPVIRYKLDCTCTVVTKQFSWENVVGVLSIERCSFCYRNFEILYFFLQFCTIITAGYDITKTWDLSSQWN